MQKSAPLPRKQKSAPSPRKQKSAPSPIKQKSAPLPRKQKSAPLPRKQKSSTSSPKQQVAPRKTSPPPNISNIPEDLRIKILNSIFDFEMKLDNKVIFNYLRGMPNISLSNKGLKASLSFTRPSWKNVRIINLQNLEINQAILRVLNMTICDQITTIVLRSISFDTDETRAEFLKFFRKNTKIRYLILDDIKIDEEGFIKMLNISGTFTELILLEISKCVLLDLAFYPFVKVLINSKSLKYLTFANNTINVLFYNYLFTKDKDNEIYINNTPYKIHISREYNNIWCMIVKTDNGTLLHSFEVNIVGNTMTDSMNIFNYRNDFAKNVKFIE